MDSLITAAARALSIGDPLGALKRVALRDDAPALALRGIAIAQLGDFERAKALLRRAASAFGSSDPVARARCIVAEAEVALAARELSWSETQLHSARELLESRGDTVNSAHARYIEIRRELLVGRIDAAEKQLREIDPRLSPALETTHHLLLAGIALRRINTRLARFALDQAMRAAQRSGITALITEVESAAEQLTLPAARLVVSGREQPLLLEDVEKVLGSTAFIVDACRNAVLHENNVISLATRPVLFTLVRVLAEAWPEGASRDELVTRAFRAKDAGESHRARLRVEIGRLRRLLRPIAAIGATTAGFLLVPHRACELAVMARPIEERHGDLLALLADGEPWASSALAIALGSSQRSVQRALDKLADRGKVQAFGRGRNRRWAASIKPGFTTILLLPASLPID